jgi:hypothetical protein
MLAETSELRCATANGHCWTSSNRANCPLFHFEGDGRPRLPAVLRMESVYADPGFRSPVARVHPPESGAIETIKERSIAQTFQVVLHGIVLHRRSRIYRPYLNRMKRFENFASQPRVRHEIPVTVSRILAHGDARLRPIDPKSDAKICVMSSKVSRRYWSLAPNGWRDDRLLRLTGTSRSCCSQSHRASE